MYFRLALALGYRHPDHLLDELTSRQIAEWFAFVNLDGLADARLDFGFGQVCATLANIHRREGQDAYRPDDFMPSLRAVSSTRTTPDEQAVPDADAQSRLISALLGKKE